MRLSLFILGAFAAVVCIQKSADAQNDAWCISKPGDETPQCRYTTLEQCLADRLGKGGSCGPSPYSTSPQSPPSTRPRRRANPAASREICRNPTRLVCGEQFGRRSPATSPRWFNR